MLQKNGNNFFLLSALVSPRNNDRSIRGSGVKVGLLIRAVSAPLKTSCHRRPSMRMITRLLFSGSRLNTSIILKYKHHHSKQIPLIIGHRLYIIKNRPDEIGTATA